MNLHNELDLSLIIDKALDYYDNKNIEFNKYIQSNDMIVVDRDNNKININNKEFKYEVLGVFDNMSHVWMWGWMIPELMYNETNIVRELLNYGLKINPTNNKISNDRLYLKTQLVNSRFLLEDEFQLELHLAIASYLAKDNFNFIYNKRKYLNKEKTKYITLYYLII